ncbi:MAG TPA: redox-sensing transcriptional repressor Rex, partial [bacterium]|nr:redox-sensing transcriptional repressor Rex [bacterium]
VWEIAVVGAGDIGSAIARYHGLANRGFCVKLIFDNDAKRIGTQIGPFTVQDSAHMKETIQEAGIKIALIAVPATHAQEVADELVESGIKAILNYAPLNLNVPTGVRVQHIDPATHLQRMTYYL